VTDRDATPADAPFARRMRSEHDMDPRMHQHDSLPEDQRGRISRVVPELPPLPVNPTIHDVAERYATFAVFMMAQWPLLADAIDVDREAHARLERLHKTHFIWPLVTGFSLALAIVSIFIVCGHR
jgi:hypothetical protein